MTPTKYLMKQIDEFIDQTITESAKPHACCLVDLATMQEFNTALEMDDYASEQIDNDLIFRKATEKQMPVAKYLHQVIISYEESPITGFYDFDEAFAELKNNLRQKINLNL